MRTGRSFRNMFVDNFLRGNNRLDDGSPELLVQYYTSHDTFGHNTIIATNRGHIVYGTVPGGTAHGNRSDHNDLFPRDRQHARRCLVRLVRTHVRQLLGVPRATGQDRHSRFSHVR